ncbi:MAG TPA: glycosyltransferase family 4 protein [Chlamydiales bacterium]|nr:glycosyltransferase family 4 protein [Chlamydiales bacterium]
MKHVVLLKSRANSCGGLEKHATRITDAFAARGARVTVLTTGTIDRTGPIAFHAAKTLSWPGFLRMEQFDLFVRNWLKNNSADIVFGMDRNRFQTHIRAGNGVHAAYLESRLLTEGRLKGLLCQLNPLHRKILALEKCAFENPELKKIFTNSQMVKDEILAHYRTDPAKIQVIHNGVEWHEMEPRFAAWERDRALSLQKFGLDPNRFHILFIGHGYLRKGLDRLLIALSRLRKRNFSLSVIGKDKQLDLYRAKVLQLGLKDHVHFFGPSREVPLFYQLADALAIPSFYDPFANVTVEALAMGLFVISSKHNGGHEILTPENGAIIEDLLDTDAMISALETAFRHRKTALSALSIRQSVQHLDFSNQLRTLIDGAYE